MNTITKTKKDLSDAQAIKKAMWSIGKKIEKLEPNFRKLGVKSSLRGLDSDKPDHHLHSNNGYYSSAITFEIGAKSERIKFPLSTKDKGVGRRRRDLILAIFSNEVAQ